MSLSPENVRVIVEATLQLQEERLQRMEHAIVDRAVSASLAAWGIDATDKDELKELKLDQTHNRKWRKSVERASTVTLTTAIGVLVSGFLGMMYIGFLKMTGKG